MCLKNMWREVTNVLRYIFIIDHLYSCGNSAALAWMVCPDV